ncbi:cytochrome P450 76C1-like protein [Tanacetum coccineum]|uniref:Cytochrome P450 76C1-like protein n=1 Tax=Tanacetum coccineum TaxID=301880 RepID=A0ABQ4WBU0_9ASTR
MDLAKVVLREQDETFANRNPPLAASIGMSGHDIVWSNNNSDWRKLRKIFVHEVLNNKNLEACRVYRRDEIVELTSQLNVSDIFPSLARFDIQGIVLKAKLQRKQIDQIFTSIIHDRKRKKSGESKVAVKREERTDFLQILLDLMEEKNATSFSLTQIKAILSDYAKHTVDESSSLVKTTFLYPHDRPSCKSCIVAGLHHPKRLYGLLVNVWGLFICDLNLGRVENPSKFNPERFYGQTMGVQEEYELNLLPICGPGGGYGPEFL